MEKSERSYFNTFKISLGFSVVAFLCNLIAFVSPYWLQSIPSFDSQFVKLGLWVACFKDYVHPEDYVSKKYNGCWYIYYPEFKYILSWLNPRWFFCVQWLATLSFVCNLIVLIVISLKFCLQKFKIQRRSNALMVIAQFIAFACLATVVILMGVMSKDRQWMPRHDQNQLSWSFGFAVMAGFFTAFSCITLSCHYMTLHWPNGPFGPAQPQPLSRDYLEPPVDEQSTFSGPGRGTTSGAMTSAKHREAMQSYRPITPGYGGGGHSTLQSYAGSTV